jgi:hypothetical protein
MQLTLEPTEQFFLAGEVMVRAWAGSDDRGQRVVALIAGVALATRPGDVTIGLVEIPPPTVEEARRWAQEVFTRHGS